MILILSDNSRRAVEIEKQLEYYGDAYLNYFTDFKVAGSHGKGSVIVGKGEVQGISAAISENGITALIDCIKEPCSEVSRGAQKACALHKIRYVKYLNITDKPGLKLKLYYAHIADMIKRSLGSTLLYASPKTISAIAELAGREGAEKMYAPVQKSMMFDTDGALEYSIPILNIIESEWMGSEEDTAVLIKRTGADLVVCDGTVVFDDVAAASFKAGVPVVLTHSMGMEFCCASATARDAVISVHTG